jgi:hypothetical protein
MAKEPTIVNDAPESAPSARGRHPHLYGTLVGLGVFAVVAAPAAMTALGAVVSFTGCFVGGSEPKPVAGGVLTGSCASSLSAADQVV